MWTLITDCDNFMKFYNKYKNVYLYFNKENNKIISIDILDNQTGSAITIEELDLFNLEKIIGHDYDVYKFIITVLEVEEKKER